MKKMMRRLTALISCAAMMINVYTPSAIAMDRGEIREQLIDRLYQSSGTVSCDFDSYKNTKGRHEGIDFTKSAGATVYSLIDGEVVNVAVASGGLSTIAIYDSANDKTVVYLHTADILVSTGQHVSCGQAVAHESNAGASAAHTHVEVRDGRRTAAAKSVGDYTLENEDPYPYWELVLTGEQPVNFESYLFNADFYYSKYTDLWNAFGDNNDALYEHWRNNGISEGRAASVFLDLGYYVARYPDLAAAFGDDYSAAYDHFLNHGCEEARATSLVYDGVYYRDHNPDLAGFSGTDLFLHFINHGVYEGRQASAEFDPAYYRAMNPDLDTAYGDNWYNYYFHYLAFGHDEGRKCVGAIKSVDISNVTSSGYTVTVRVVDQNRVAKVCVPVWTQGSATTDAKAQDDLAADWQTRNIAKLTGTNTYTFNVKTSDHKNESGKYCNDVYVFEGSEILDRWCIETGHRTYADVPAAPKIEPATTAAKPFTTTRAATKPAVATTTTATPTIPAATTQKPTEAPTAASVTEAIQETSGDANGDGRVNVADAVAVLQYVANKSKYSLTEQGEANADCDGVKGITGGDAIYIQKLDAGIL